MSIAANPLLSELVLEGIKQAGDNNPSTTTISRATNNWIEEIKNDIWNLAKKPKVLHITSYSVLNRGQSRYAYPSDFSSDLSLSVLSGSYSGLAQNGAVNNISLASTDNSGDNIIGKEILITAGTAVGSCAQITSYNSTTKIAYVVPDFATAPVNGDSYLIIDQETPIETRPIFDRDSRVQITSPSLPLFAYSMGDDSEGYFILNCPPDKLYGVRLRYYADITQIDSSSALMSTIYRRWRNVFVQGIKAKKLADEDDDRLDPEERKYANNLKMLLYREIYGVDLSNIVDRVTDYW